jgi:Uma2 family endonuclease
MPLTIPKAGSLLLHEISWEEFEALLAEKGERSNPQLAYDRGTLEIVTPLPEHEGYKEIIGDLIKDLADELDIDYESFGSTTWKRQDRLAGAEPDNCFYIQNAGAVRGKLDIDLSQDPPPDLVLEIDITSKSLNRLPIYARLGIPEVWRYHPARGQGFASLKIYQRQGENFQETDNSLAFPNVPVKEIPGFIAQNLASGRRKIRKAFRTWVRQFNPRQ